ncbi:pyruvate dehydrogenase [Pholiota molesta]|nr:pyruvate dehydrogenase [Pholiota molesta]
MLSPARSPSLPKSLNAINAALRHRRANSTLEPPPAGGHLPSIATSEVLKTKRETALRTPGIIWADEDPSFPTRAIVAGRETRKMNTYQAIRDAMSIALAKDDSAVVFGEDVAFGGVFRCTMGLAEEFGKERVFNTPLTEQGIAGFGIDYIFPAFDQIVNEAAKIRYRSGNGYNAGGSQFGHGGLYHSQSPEGFFMGASGLKVVIPRSPIQAKGLLLGSIRDPNPVIFMEPKVLYRSAVEQVPIDDYTLPLGQAEILVPGSDLTLLTWGTPVYHCETALHMLSSPAPDSRLSILPWDMETIVESVNRTGPGLTAGVGAEISAEIQKKCFLKLNAPVKRVGGWDLPNALQYEKFHIPDAIRVLDAVVETLTY